MSRLLDGSKRGSVVNKEECLVLLTQEVGNRKPGIRQPTGPATPKYPLLTPSTVMLTTLGSKTSRQVAHRSTSALGINFPYINVGWLCCLLPASSSLFRPSSHKKTEPYRQICSLSKNPHYVTYIFLELQKLASW
eukprot:965743-Pelagomonas_calceolata.AAC.1